jgi:hypothetical protein
VSQRLACKVACKVRVMPGGGGNSITPRSPRLVCCGRLGGFTLLMIVSCLSCPTLREWARYLYDEYYHLKPGGKGVQ